MTRKVKISFLILVWGIVAIQLYINHMDQSALRKNAIFPSANHNNRENVITAFSMNSNEIYEENLKGFGYFGKMEMDEQTKQDILKTFANNIGIKDGYMLSAEEGDNYTKTCLRKEGKYADTLLQFITMQENEEIPEQYLWVDVATQADIEQIKGLYDKISETYQDMDISANVNMEYTIKWNGNLEEDEQEKKAVIGEIFSELEAKQVAILDNPDYNTVYGYTKEDDNYYEVDGKKINVQIVFSYSEPDDITYMKVGCPIVNSSY